jgi:hypothetical protein
MEYMQNRNHYDHSIGETEETAYMRDVINFMVDVLMGQEALDGKASDDALLAVETNHAGTDALYFAKDREGAPKSTGRRCFLLRHPNTGCADLFSYSIMEKAANELGAAVVPPEEFRRRVLALFRPLHFRIHRAVSGGANRFAKYGVDAGLREADNQPEVLRVKTDHPKYHKEMLQHQWVVREYVGYEPQGKKKHTNQNLVSVLFVEHLQLKRGKVQAVEKRARKHIDAMREKAEASHKQIRKELKAAKVPVKVLKAI